MVSSPAISTSAAKAAVRERVPAGVRWGATGAPIPFQLFSIVFMRDGWWCLCSRNLAKRSSSHDKVPSLQGSSVAGQLATAGGAPDLRRSLAYAFTLCTLLQPTLDLTAVRYD